MTKLETEQLVNYLSMMTAEKICFLSFVNLNPLPSGTLHCKKNLRDSWIFLIKSSWDWEKSMLRREYYRIFCLIKRKDFSCLGRSYFPKYGIQEISRNIPSCPREKRHISCRCFQTRETKPNEIFLSWTNYDSTKGYVKWKKETVIFGLAVWFYFIFGDDVNLSHIIFPVHLNLSCPPPPA